MDLRSVSAKIIHAAIHSALPDEAVKRALLSHPLSGNVTLVAIGKAAWQMAHAAVSVLPRPVAQGIVITKYGHALGSIPGVHIFEAGHPVPDANSYLATQAVIDMVSPLSSDDTVLFLVSGGGSALFEKPLIPESELADVTRQLLSRGADIQEMNMIRKRLSAVKGGRFGLLCAPAHVFTIVLSDVLGDPLDVIASGPAYPDTSTAEQALNVIAKYHLTLSAQAHQALKVPLPAHLDHVETVVTGSVRQLCSAAADCCKALNIEPHILTASLNCEAREAGRFLASIAQFHAHSTSPVAYILGGETVVHLTGGGKGGRNQELALSSAEGISGLSNVAVFSVGSDGTDGPTDAAGGYVDGRTLSLLKQQNIRISDVLQRNDSYHALKKTDGLIFTGPTGTNVNDLIVLLIDACSPSSMEPA